MGPSFSLKPDVPLWFVLISFGGIVFVIAFVWLGWLWICIVSSVVSILLLWLVVRRSLGSE